MFRFSGGDAKYWSFFCLIVLAVFGVLAFTLAALITGEWRYLAGSVVCCVIIRPLLP